MKNAITAQIIFVCDLGSTGLRVGAKTILVLTTEDAPAKVASTATFTAAGFQM